MISCLNDDDKEIVILIRSLPFHGIGGMELVVWDLARTFVRMGFGVRIITTRIPGRDREFVHEGVKVVPIADAPEKQYSLAWWSLSRRYIEKNCLNRVHAIISVSAAGFGVLHLRSRSLSGVPFIMQAHGTSLGEVISKWSSRRLSAILSSLRNMYWLPIDLLAYKKFDHVVAVGERVYRDLTNAPISMSLSNDKVVLINNGIDDSVFDPPNDEGVRITRRKLGISDGETVFVSASRLHIQKGVHHCIAAFAEYLKFNPNSVYLVAGDGSELAALKKLASSLGVQDRVYFLGALGRSELAAVLKSSDLFLFLTERVEGLPLNVLEALSTGLPAVISEHLDIFESECLVKVNQRNVQQIVSAIDLMLKTNKRETRLSKLPSEYSLSFSARRYIQLMKLSTCD